MRNTLTAGLGVMLLFVLLQPTAAQEWSAAQKEVWKNVEAYSDLYLKGDVEGFLSYFDQDFSGWPAGSPLPQSKATREKFIRYNMPKSKVLFYHMEPLSIRVYGDFAFVHYTFMSISQGKDGKENYSSGRWTDILRKKGDRWLMIGDAGGQMDGDDDDEEDD